MSVQNLVVLFADQLSRGLSSLRHADRKRDAVLMMEVSGEVEAVPHHRKKVAFLFSAMRHFAAELERDGWQVRYVRLDDPENTGSFGGEVERAVNTLDPARLIATEPGDWRVLQAVKSWEEQFGVPLMVLEDDRFVSNHEEFQGWAKGRKQLRMEYFYRDMRRKTGLLMDGDQPAEGRWNFDSENRMPAADSLFMPAPAKAEVDPITLDVIDMLEAHYPDGYGDLQPFFYAVTRTGALAALEHFIDVALADFGTYQDAMLQGQPFLYHSLLALYLNAGLLDPLEICKKVETAYREGKVPINSAEGYIRQIIGWREYVRGIYWLKMPGYLDENYFEADRPLPSFYWTAQTDLNCLKQALTQTKQHAYAHHIQRLMVTGNFAMLIGVSPREIHEWYLAVYVDAFEWVELPNTLGMSQFADGGLLGSKPYAAGGNYINKMSDYCKGCRYKVSKKTGAEACPFNSLYWHFLDRHKEQLGSNPRLGPVYRTWSRMSDEKKADYLETADAFLSSLA